MKDIVAKLKNLDCFSTINEKTLIEMSSNFEIKYIKNREVIFEENVAIKNLYIVLFGTFKIQKNVIDNTPVILNFLNRGEFLGIAMAGITVPKYPASAIAIEDCAVLQFDRNYFLDVLMKIESVKTIVNQQISERFLEFQNDRCMEKARIPQKIADLLLRLCRRYNNYAGTTIPMPITRKDIAQRVGTHTETVIRVLSRWTKNGWVDTKNKQIEILNVKEIERIATTKSQIPVVKELNLID